MISKIKIIVHLGYPKTGTTSLQSGFFNSFDDLIYLGKFGEKNFATIVRKNFFHVLNDIPVLKNSVFKEKYNDESFVESFDSTKKYLISEENLLYDCLRPHHNLEGGMTFLENLIHNLRYFFSEKYFDLTLIFVRRNQADIIESLYAQSYENYYKLNKKMNTFDKFVNNLVNVNSIYGPVLDYDLVNSKFKEAFCQSDLKWVSYEDLHNDPKEFYSQFAKLLNVKSSFNDNIILNKRSLRGKGKKSRPKTLYSLLKRLRVRYFQGCTLTKFNWLSKILLAIRLPSKTVYFSLSENQARKIKAYYSKSEKR